MRAARARVGVRISGFCRVDNYRVVNSAYYSVVYELRIHVCIPRYIAGSTMNRSSTAATLLLRNFVITTSFSTLQCPDCSPKKQVPTRERVLLSTIPARARAVRHAINLLARRGTDSTTSSRRGTEAGRRRSSSLPCPRMLVQALMSFAGAVASSSLSPTVLTTSGPVVGRTVDGVDVRVHKD